MADTNAPELRNGAVGQRDGTGGQAARESERETVRLSPMYFRLPRARCDFSLRTEAAEQNNLPNGPTTWSREVDDDFEATVSEDPRPDG